jgi:type VI protein secretion system component Hcp
MTFRIQKKWHWLVALGAVFVPGIVTGALSLPFTFSAGQPIRASEVNANFEALRAQLAALSGPPALPAVGTLTVAGVVTQVPIHKFTQSVSVPSTGVGASAKPSLSDIQVTLDVGSSAPLVNFAVSQSKVNTSADIALGNFSLHLTSVVLDHVTVGPARGGVAQQTLSLSYKTVDWSWQVGTNPQKVVSYDVGAGTGGGSTVKSFSYGYFAPAVTPDATFLPISGYTHDINCPPTAKCIPGAFSVQKSIDTDTLDALGLATSNAGNLSVDVEWFLVAGTASNSVQLTHALIVGVELSTGDDGSLSQSVDFNYGQITWKAGTQVESWAVAGQGA